MKITMTRKQVILSALYLLFMSGLGIAIGLMRYYATLESARHAIRLVAA